MQITIDNYDSLLEFVKREDISPIAAIDVFEGAFNIVAIILMDAITREPQIVKAQVVEKIEAFINNCKIGQFDNVVLFN